MFNHCFEGEDVAVALEPHDLSDTAGSNQAFMPDFFAGVRVAQMDFDSRHFFGDGFNRVTQPQTCMSIGGRIDDDAVKFSAAVADPGNEIAFGVALPEFQHDTAQLFRTGVHILRNRSKGFRAVDFRLARTEKVQVRTVQNKNFERFHGGSSTIEPADSTDFLEERGKELTLP